MPKLSEGCAYRHPDPDGYIQELEEDISGLEKYAEELEGRLEREKAKNTDPHARQRLASRIGGAVAVAGIVFSAAWYGGIGATAVAVSAIGVFVFFACEPL